MSAAALLVGAVPAFSGEIAIQNMDGAPFADRLVMNDMGINGRSLPVHDSAVLRVRNAGTTPLAITGLATTGPFTVTGATTPAALAVGSSVDLRVTYAATGPGSPDAWRHDGTLRITSDDPDRPVLTVELAGLWQDRPEGSNERTLEQIVDVFGYATTISSAGQRLGNNGRVQAVGEEVLTAYWKRPDVSEPVTVRQIVSFRDPVGTPFDWFAKGSPPASSSSALPPGSFPADSPLMDTRSEDQQTLFPRQLGSSTPATITFTPTAQLFGLHIEDAVSDPALNPPAPACNGACGHVIRAWPAEDRSGARMPATYIVALDHLNDDASGNYDYQDAVYVVENVVPEATPTDTVPPAIASRTPAPGATGVPSDSAVRVTFTEPVDADSVQPGTATISAAGATLPATVEAVGNTVTIDPAGLVPGAAHTVRLAQITDTSGNPISTTTWTFTAAGAAAGGGGTAGGGTTGGTAGGTGTTARAAGSPAAAAATGDPSAVAAAARCAPLRRTASSRTAATRADAASLAAIRRTTQSALRRIGAVERRLGQGLTARDLCGGSFTAGRFAAGVTLGTGGPAVTDVARPRPLRVGAVPRGRVPVSAAALAVLDRDARTALRRLDVLERRLGGGLTGADLAPGALTAAKLAPGLVVLSATGPEPARARVRAATAARTVRVPLTAARVRSTARLADAALRRADALVARLEAGVPGRSFRAGSIGPQSISD